MSKKKRFFADAEPEIQLVDSATEEAVSIAPVPSGPTVGQQLRAAREAAKLDIQEVARTLKFSPRQIELLEADDYAALPGNTIVRGFVRSYGRFLKLDVEPLVRMLDARTPRVTADVRPPDNMGTARQPWEGRQVPVIVAIFIALLGLVVVSLGLWHFYGPALTKPIDPTSPPTAVQQLSPTVSVPVESPVVEPASLVAAGDSAAPGMPPVVPGDNAQPRLVLVFEGRSWVEVMDAMRQTIHSGENLAGSQLKLDGRPPFDLVIGNATRVKLAYGERTIDLTPHTRADVARLRVE